MEDINEELNENLKEDVDILKQKYKLDFAEMPMISVNRTKMNLEGGVTEQEHILLKSYNILDCLKIFDALEIRIKKNKDKTIKTKTETNDIAN